MKPSQNPILSSLKESFKLIKKKKRYFSILLITHVIFLLVISLLLLNYSANIGEEIEKMVEPLESLSNTTTVASAESYMALEELESVETAYSNIVNYLIVFGLLLFLSYMIINGINWNIANLIVNKSSSFKIYWLMFGISFLFFSFLGALLIGFFLRLSTYTGNNQLTAFITTIFFIVITYLAYISFGLIRKYKPKKIKEFLKHTLKIAYKKPEILFFSYMIIFLAVLLSAAIVYRLLYALMPFLILSIIFLILAMSWGKVFFLTAVKNSEKK
ncbi:hypothetical protein GF361_03960 [Candidatus Woesearchaeota archaeon]|nr:hypothetical protein [Candidatus Woesearchaeota archaeon]